MAPRDLTEDKREFALEIIKLVQECNAVDFKAMREDIGKIRADVSATAHDMRAAKRILEGEPSVKRPGLVELVDKHEMLVTKCGGAFCAIWVAWEVVKATILKSH